MNDVIWRGMTRAELDAAYNNSAAVKNSAAKVAEWTERSASFRSQNPGSLDLAYGAKPRNRIDIFRCGRDAAPLFVFLHGGYWQRNSKEVFACMAEGPLARGFDVATIGYTLAPEATLSEIVTEVRAALHWLRDNAAKLGVSSERRVISGWSAGGHLTAMALSDTDAGLAISGVFDVEPCRLNYLNDALHLSGEEQITMSPIRHLPSRSGPFVVAYGAAELPELQRQSRDYHAARVATNLPSELLALAAHDHFSILEELVAPDGQLTEAAVGLIREMT
jgi:arylformamidase